MTFAENDDSHRAWPGQLVQLFGMTAVKPMVWWREMFAPKKHHF